MGTLIGTPIATKYYFYTYHISCMKQCTKITAFIQDISQGSSFTISSWHASLHPTCLHRLIAICIRVQCSQSMLLPHHTQASTQAMAQFGMLVLELIKLAIFITFKSIDYIRLKLVFSSINWPKVLQYFSLAAYSSSSYAVINLIIKNCIMECYIRRHVLL